MSEQFGWKVDVNACVGCRSCEMACKVENDLKAGQGRRRRVIEKTLVEASETGPDTVRTFFLSLACNHCESPACMAACPRTPDGDPTDLAYDPSAAQNTNALWKDTTGASSGAVVGVVRVNSDLCIGCRRCEWACPYGAPQYNPTTQTIHKCEMCWQRISNTDLHPSRRVGACVATCLGQSIKQDLMDTATASYTHTRNDWDSGETDKTTGLTSGEGLLDPTVTVTSGSQDYSVAPVDNGPDFVRPGVDGRGSAYVADAAMTEPALRIRNRVYVLRDGSGVE